MDNNLQELHTALTRLSEIFYVSVGALQRDAPLVQTTDDIPVTCWTEEQIKKNSEGNKILAKTSAKDIIETCKKIDFLIDNLPGINRSEVEQVFWFNVD